MKSAIFCLLFVCLISLTFADNVNMRNRAWKRKLMQTSETTVSESSVTGGLSSESEDIPSYSYSSGVTESYRNWDGEDTPLVDSDWFDTLVTILGGIVIVGVIIAVIAAIVLGAVYVVKKRNAKKSTVGSAEYVLMENDVADLAQNHSISFESLFIFNKQ
eukprot:TRINITY_DN24538_c0_g1_i1.p2 TRINITY_DN24538_c0_g1~~TRINITY_DN24538_c0_g1_i1.p2  ORF type:complete len:160 (+),score=18.19 TRINITY_DN24538_c0_g1_i1:74-553(+)